MYTTKPLYLMPSLSHGAHFNKGHTSDWIKVLLRLNESWWSNNYILWAGNFTATFWLSYIFSSSRINLESIDVTWNTKKKIARRDLTNMIQDKFMAKQKQVLTFTLPRVTWDFPYMDALRSVPEEPVVPAFAPTPALFWDWLLDT